MRRAVTVAGTFVLAGAAQNTASIVSHHAVRQAFGISGPMCPTFSARAISAVSYLGLLAVLVGAVGVAATWVNRERFGVVGTIVAGAIIATGLFRGIQGLAMHVPAIRAVALANVVAANAFLAWRHAATVAVGAAIGLGNWPGGQRRE